MHKIAHIIMKNSVMISKFTISGTEFISEVIASFRLLFLEISLNGLRILSKRRAFRNEISYYEKAILNIAEATIKKSSMFQPFFI